MGDGAESTIGIPRFRLVTESTVYRRQCIADSVSQTVYRSWSRWCLGLRSRPGFGDLARLRGRFGAIAQKSVESLMFFARF
jgi:hypothetical protein